MPVPAVRRHRERLLPCTDCSTRVGARGVEGIGLRLQNEKNYECGGWTMYAFSTRRIGCALLALVVSTCLAQDVLAHHGWGWATAEEFELTGQITQVRLGNPHGEVTLDVVGE